MREEINDLREKSEEGNRRCHNERGWRNTADRRVQWRQGAGRLGKEEDEGATQTQYV